MSGLVGAKSLLGFERFSTLRADVADRSFRLVDDLVGVKSRRRLERLSTSSARERTFGGVDGRVNFQVASIHKRTTANFTDVPGSI